jgi:hypothetical protein
VTQHHPLRYMEPDMKLDMEPDMQLELELDNTAPLKQQERWGAVIADVDACSRLLLPQSQSVVVYVFEGRRKLFRRAI